MALQGRRETRLTLAGALGIFLAAAQPALSCSLGPGRHVLLASQGMHPEVFVWDSSDRLQHYLSGSWGSTREVMRHTILVPAGTVAVVTACRAHEGSPQDDYQDSDVYAIKLLSGAHRAGAGWVAAADLHVAPAKASK